MRGGASPPFLGFFLRPHAAFQRHDDDDDGEGVGGPQARLGACTAPPLHSSGGGLGVEVEVAQPSRREKLRIARRPVLWRRATS
ncbi:hypothetical protein GUJ93_ZPchr0006g45332 [Zizania palustris]|uniref:Uncharacterized protein n=1 Tax=Zizania palustris TaxID=103762 RepID=A0A8J5T412_ZIZPA|nr:hypothetical protein GUJ93_ZPchr0006g45332 [Zizania palustris]